MFLSAQQRSLGESLDSVHQSPGGCTTPSNAQSCDTTSAIKPLHTQKPLNCASS